jgi:two-component system, OmpR family, KDP operon response regulator KdpE
VTRAVQILLVDDEVAIQRAMAPLLRSRGYGVTVAGSGHEALASAERERPDLIILDLGLPDMDGTEVCRRVRERSETPILILSARGSERDKVAALDQGADDYVTKPFGPEELLARVRVALRRSIGREATLRGQLRSGDLTIDFDRHRVSRADVDIRLTPKELALLTLLVTHAGRVLTHRTILKAVWGSRGVEQAEHLRVLMGQLRKKIEPDPAHPRYLLTEPWVGYRFAEDPEESQVGGSSPP